MKLERDRSPLKLLSSALFSQNGFGVDGGAGVVVTFLVANSAKRPDGSVVTAASVVVVVVVVGDSGSDGFGTGALGPLMPKPPSRPPGPPKPPEVRLILVVDSNLKSSGFLTFRYVFQYLSTYQVVHEKVLWRACVHPCDHWLVADVEVQPPVVDGLLQSLRFELFGYFDSQLRRHHDRHHAVVLFSAFTNLTPEWAT